MKSPALAFAFLGYRRKRRINTRVWKRRWRVAA